MPELLEHCSVLREMYESKQAVGLNGESFPIHSNLSSVTAETLYQVVRSTKPKLVIEIGMAFGFSSLAILTALQETGQQGRLISIDPYQSTQWMGCGLRAVERAGFETAHTHIEDFDYCALPKLLESKRRIQFAFIDGWHTFDYTLLDFWFLDRMLDADGVIGFDDCQYLAVDKVIRFVRSHRKYEELNVGLTADASNARGLRGRIKALAGTTVANWMRKLTGRQARVHAAPNRYFKKCCDWEPDWDYFQQF